VLTLLPGSVPLVTGDSGEAELAAGMHVNLLPLTSPYPEKVKDRLGKKQ
jgi:hypothetical protein